MRRNTTCCARVRRPDGIGSLGPGALSFDIRTYLRPTFRAAVYPAARRHQVVHSCISACSITVTVRVPVAIPMSPGSSARRGRHPPVTDGQTSLGPYGYVLKPPSLDLDLKLKFVTIAMRRAVK